MKTNDKEVKLINNSNLIYINNVEYRLNGIVQIRYGRIFVPIVEFCYKVFDCNVKVNGNLIEIVHSEKAYNQDQYKSIAGKFIKDNNGFVFPVYGNESNQNFIDEKGEIIPNYISSGMKLEASGTAACVFSFYEGFAYALKTSDSPGRYISESGKWLTEGYIDDSSRFSEGLGVIYQNGKYGYIDAKGEIKIPIEHTDINSAEFEFRGGKLSFASGDYRKGEKHWLEFSEGLVPYFDEKSDDKLIGYMDQNGITVIQPKYEYASSFHNGRAKIGVRNDKGHMYFGYIDHDGKEIIPPKFGIANNFSEGLAYVEIDDDKGFIDINGEKVLEIDSNLNVEEGYFEGYVAVSNRSKYPYMYGFMDKYGTMITKMEFWANDLTFSVSRFQNGLAYVPHDEFIGYINTQGEYVWKKENEHYN